MQAPPLLFIIRSSPYGGNRAREGLDAALASAVFEQPLAVLFMGDGVFAMKKGQIAVQGATVEQMLGALPLYDVERVYLHRPSLWPRGLIESDLCFPAALLDDDETACLIQTSRHSLDF